MNLVKALRPFSLVGVSRCSLRLAGYDAARIGAKLQIARSFTSMHSSLTSRPANSPRNRCEGRRVTSINQRNVKCSPRIQHGSSSVHRSMTSLIDSWSGRHGTRLHASTACLGHPSAYCGPTTLSRPLIEHRTTNNNFSWYQTPSFHDGRITALTKNKTEERSLIREVALQSGARASRTYEATICAQGIRGKRAMQRMSNAFASRSEHASPPRVSRRRSRHAPSFRARLRPLLRSDARSTSPNQRAVEPEPTTARSR